MHLTDQFPLIVKNLRYEAPWIFPERWNVPAESPDLLAVYALASAMEAIHHDVEDGCSGLAEAQDEDGGLGIMRAALNYAWVFECLACNLVDWEKTSEVWPYWVQEHAGEILKLTGEGESFSGAFQDAASAWLVEQPGLVFAPIRERPGEWVPLVGRNQPLPEQHKEVFLLSGTGQIRKGYRNGNDWFLAQGNITPGFHGAVTHWAEVVKK